MSDFFEKLKKGKEKIEKFGDEQRKARQATPLPIIMLNDALPLLVVVTYILLGCLGGWWHPGWLVFFLIPIYYMLAEAIVHKSLELVPIAPITVAVYLCLGCIGGMWHPYWAVFLAIPVYYTTVAAIKGANWSKVFDILVPILTVGVYLVLGFVCKAWHPGWVVFFLIPITGSFEFFLTGGFRSRIEKHKKAFRDSVEEELGIHVEEDDGHIE